MNLYLRRCERAIEVGELEAARALILPLRNLDRQKALAPRIGELERRALGTARWRIDSTPTGCEVAVIGLENGNPSERPRKLGRTPIDEQDIPPGDYLLLLSHPDRVELRYPVRIGRGERRELSLILLHPSQVPEGMVYVAAGAFLMGDAQAGTVRSMEVPGFFIDRTEVTGAEYERFVQATGTPPPDGWERSANLPGGAACGPRAQRELVRRLCLRAVGRQAAPDRDRVGKGSSRRGRTAVPLGQQIRPAEGNRPPRHPPR